MGCGSSKSISNTKFEIKQTAVVAAPAPQQTVVNLQLDANIQVTANTTIPSIEVQPPSEECAGEENDENVKVNSVATSCEDLMNMPQTDASTNTEKQKQGIKPPLIPHAVSEVDVQKFIDDFTQQQEREIQERMKSKQQQQISVEEKLGERKLKNRVEVVAVVSSQAQ